MAKTDNSTETTATLDQVASLNFEPWKHEEGEWTPPSNEEWARLAILEGAEARILCAGTVVAMRAEG